MNKDMFEMLDNFVSKFHQENEIKANSGTKGAAFHIALICLLKNFSNKKPNHLLKQVQKYLQN